jgi:hypothetical protein
MHDGFPVRPCPSPSFQRPERQCSPPPPFLPLRSFKMYHHCQPFLAVLPSSVFGVRCDPVQWVAGFLSSRRRQLDFLRSLFSFFLFIPRPPCSLTSHFPPSSSRVAWLASTLPRSPSLSSTPTAKSVTSPLSASLLMIDAFFCSGRLVFTSVPTHSSSMRSSTPAPQMSS